MLIMRNYDEIASKLDQFSEKGKDQHNAVLDDEHDYHSIAIAAYVDKNHLMYRLSAHIAEKTHLPINTVFLIGLSVYSSMASRAYCISYEHGGRLPIGLYAVAEQPPGAAKSWCLQLFQTPFINIHKNLQGFNKSLPALFVTNATPEGLEETLADTCGHFAAFSSEQGLFNSLFGTSYVKEGRANNNDLSLSGFDGGYVCSKRVSREGYSGRVAGSIACFAQPGSIENILTASNGTGLSERFLMLAEQHNLGKRNHKAQVINDVDLFISYEQSCAFVESALAMPMPIDATRLLTISSEGFDWINSYRNEIEHELMDGGRYSNNVLRGVAGKINMQIMKIAANLHVVENQVITEVGIDKVKAAILIADAFLRSTYMICETKGVFGTKSEFTAIISYLSSSNKIRTEREIINSLRRTQPFKTMSGSKSDRIRDALKEMGKQGLLKNSINTVSGVNSWVLDQ